MDVCRLLSRLAPSVCRPCGDPGLAGLDLCSACYRALPGNRWCCVRCAEPLTTTGLLCGRCLQRPPDFDRVHAPWRYAPPLDWLIQELKFNGRLASGRLLGQLLARHLRKHTLHVDCLLPMPLHGSRLRERGFNQATEIARPVAAALGLPLETRLLRRSRATGRQASLALDRRTRNVAQAFAVTQAVAGLRLAVVDDVITTASTARAVAQTLKDAGAARVEIWAPARAGRLSTGNHTAAHAWAARSG